MSVSVREKVRQQLTTENYLKLRSMLGGGAHMTGEVDLYYLDPTMGTLDEATVKIPATESMCGQFGTEDDFITGWVIDLNQRVSLIVQQGDPKVAYMRTAHMSTRDKFVLEPLHPSALPGFKHLDTITGTILNAITMLVNSAALTTNAWRSRMGISKQEVFINRDSDWFMANGALCNLGYIATDNTNSISATMNQGLVRFGHKIVDDPGINLNPTIIADYRSNDTLVFAYHKDMDFYQIGAATVSGKVAGKTIGQRFHLFRDLCMCTTRERRPVFSEPEITLADTSVLF